jgi:hypothetical protein
MMMRGAGRGIKKGVDAKEGLPGDDGETEADIRLRSPFTAMVCGPTGSGKTTALLDIIAQSATIAVPAPAEIIYCFGARQDVFDTVEGVRFHEGALDLDTLPTDGNNRWLILDDLMTDISGSKSTVDLYTKHSHHRNISVFFVVQDLFLKDNRTISRNTHYFVLMKNPRDTLSLTNLAKQLPQDTRFVKEVYALSTAEPHSYLLIDVKQATDDSLRFIGNYGSLTRDMVAYVPVGASASGGSTVRL